MADNREENNDNRENNNQTMPNYYEDAAFVLVIAMGFAVAVMFWIQVMTMYREMVERNQFNHGERGFWIIRKIIKESE